MRNLIISAHSDDEIIGVGGTIAKLISEGDEVYVLIFKYGSDLPGVLTSWPIMSPEELKKRRIKEAKHADKYLGVSETIFLGLDGNMYESWNVEYYNKFLKILKDISPDRIFFHSKFDAHKDHHFVNEKVNEILKNIPRKPQLYTYEINLWKLGIREPKVVFDVSKFFKKKIRALKFFKTQYPSIVLLEPLIYLKAIQAGKLIGRRYGEVFYEG